MFFSVLCLLCLSARLFICALWSHAGILRTQDTNGKVINSQLDTTNESQVVSPFPAGDHKAIYKQTHTKA